MKARAGSRAGSGGNWAPKTRLAGPEPRLQGTPSVASVSPLSSRALGRWVLGLLVFQLLGCRTARDSRPSSLPLESLSGDWIGSVILIQRGSCPLNGPGGSVSRLSDEVEMVASVASDGQLTASLRNLTLEELKAITWKGQVTPEYQVMVARIKPSSCQGKPNDIETHLKGFVTTTPAGLELRLSGEEVSHYPYQSGCTDLRECRYGLEYAFRRRDAEPSARDLTTRQAGVGTSDGR